MDARKLNFGIVIPMPTSQFSQLGNIVYVDESGSVVKVLNIFEGRRDFSPFYCQQQECKVSRTDISGAVAIPTASIRVQKLQESEYSR